MKNSFYISDINVNDAVSSGNSIGFDDGNTTGDDYAYDANGSMTMDKNKGITSIIYNHLNLPVEIIWSSTKKIEYIYNAAGVKVRKKVTNSVNIKTTDYLDASASLSTGSFQYNEQVLEFFPTSEGYVKATPTGLVPPGTPPSAYAFNYVFNYTDHLGNVRLSYAKDPQTGNLKILDESHYYPFGLKHQEYVNFGFVNNPIQGVIIAPLTNNPYQYKYNSKEWQDELNFNMYDMDMRQYDPAIARWVVLDPVIHHSLSPYNAFDNNPVFWADPSGAAPELGSVFEQSGMKVASLTVQGTGTSIGAGGAYTENSSTDSSNSTDKNTNGNSGSEEWPELDPDAILLDEVVITSMDQLEGALEKGVKQAYEIRNERLNSRYYGWTGFNGVLGTASGITTWKSGSLQYNELWHKTKTRGYSFATQKRWKSNMAKQWRADQTKGFQNAKNFGNKLRVVGGVAVVADIAMSGEIKPSHGINLFMLGISGTGVGSIVAGAWFIADYGTMGVNYLLNGEAKGIGDMIDEKVGTYEMYQGLY